MRVDANVGSVVVDEAHRLGEWRVEPGFREAALPSTSHEDHWPPYDDADFFSQPGALFRLMSRGQQQALFDNTARSMDDVDTAIKRRHVGHCLQADPAYGAGVAKALGLSPIGMVPGR
jgi:catalase